MIYSHMKQKIEIISYIIIVVLSFSLGVLLLVVWYFYTGIFFLFVPTFTIPYFLYFNFKCRNTLPSFLLFYIIISFFIFCTDAWRVWFKDDPYDEKSVQKTIYFIPPEWHYLYPERWFKELLEFQDAFGEKRAKQENIIYNNNTFQLYKWFQGWLYTYDAWLNIPASWRIYFKVYDLLTNTELSSDSLPERSTMSVSSTNWEVKYFSSLDHFTVYEWDWWEYYGARFELWYLPLESWTEWLQKLAEDYYIIDWWMR